MARRDTELREAATNAAREIILQNAKHLHVMLTHSCNHDAHLANLLLALVGWDPRDLLREVKAMDAAGRPHE